ncbi:hypothetical protein JTE90_023371 [Oedothorax gibbosus]|uniref:glutathione transferase n=1 Tax=Oedothorax gibbosus TaxID=931172 RepID=A0AAV6V206_9ARAC|nr:hypothetical protein JTE90_023371 [Oedothorax gibbosus]
MEKKIVFGYWNIRGLAEPIRYLLYYKKVAFVDKRYTFGEEEWYQEKFSLGLDFPNLPYLFDGHVKLTQSTTILRYLAQKYGMDGATPQDKLRVSLVEQQLIDLRVSFGMTVYSPQFQTLKQGFVEKAPGRLREVESFLGHADFICGGYVTYVDLMLAEIFDLHSYLMPEILREFPRLKDHRDRVWGLPGLKEYLSSNTYRRWPINGPMATFGKDGEEPKRE